MEEIIKLAVKDVIDSYPSMRYNKQKIKEVVIGLFQHPINVNEIDEAIHEVLEQNS
jgi:hypothetical protein